MPLPGHTTAGTRGQTEPNIKAFCLHDLNYFAGGGSMWMNCRGCQLGGGVKGSEVCEWAQELGYSWGTGGEDAKGNQDRCGTDLFQNPKIDLPCISMELSLKCHSTKTQKSLVREGWVCRWIGRWLGEYVWMAKWVGEWTQMEIWRERWMDGVLDGRRVSGMMHKWMEGWNARWG